MNIIYVDIDGVLVDIIRMISDLLGKDPISFNKYAEWYKAWGYNKERAFIDDINERLREGCRMIPMVNKDVEEFVLSRDNVILLSRHLRYVDLRFSSFKYQLARRYKRRLIILYGERNTTKADNIIPHLNQILIDDNPYEINSWNNKGGKGFLYKRPYNNGMPMARIASEVDRIISLNKCDLGE